jgi:preprotein translocase subunit Sec63
MEFDNYSNWFNSLKKAKIMHIKEDEKIEKRINYCNILEISPDTELNIKTISRAYKKLSLKLHPDKGGNVDQFSLINAAYTNLIAYQTELNDKKTSVIMEYDVIVQKIGNCIGLGIVVYEDNLRQEVVVQSVHDEIKIISLSDDSGGTIQEGNINSYIFILFILLLV